MAFGDNGSSFLGYVELMASLISKNRMNSSSVAFIVGVFSSVVQIVFLREVLALFTGNEFVLSLSLSCWMVFTAIGSRYFFLRGKWCSIHTVLFLHLVFFTIGLTLLRAIPFIVQPGEQPSPLLLIIALFITTGPTSLLSGILFGLCSNNNGTGVYRWDNAGNAAGLAIVSLLIFFYSSHRVIIVVVMVLYLFFLFDNKKIFSGAILLIICAYLIDPLSVSWKYQNGVTSINYGRTGEIGVNSDGTLITLNNYVYKTNITNAFLEQSIHVPLSIRYPERVLLIYNNNQLRELKKYPDVDFKCSEAEPLLSDSECICTVPEKINSENLFDIVILGCDVPRNLADGRMFTKEFFSMVKSKLLNGGLFSFSFNINTDFIDSYSSKINNVMVSTLQECFKYVKVFPGEGLTFVASDQEFDFPETTFVPTSYFNDYILAEISEEKIQKFNQIKKLNVINTSVHPIIINYSMNKYFETFNLNPGYILIISLLLILIILVLLFRSVPTISIGTTGFTCGLYSIAIMMIYQSYFGTLYSSLSLLMISLSAGFLVGTFIRFQVFNNITILLYATGSLLIVRFTPDLPEWVFFILNFFMGVNVAGQFIRMKENVRNLNAADLAGGIAGIGLGGTYILPVLGLDCAIAAVFIAKLLSLIPEIYAQKRIEHV